jgi:hypothetical protein
MSGNKLDKKMPLLSNPGVHFLKIRHQDKFVA